MLSKVLRFLAIQCEMSKKNVSSTGIQTLLYIDIDIGFKVLQRLSFELRKLTRCGKNLVKLYVNLVEIM